MTRRGASFSFRLFIKHRCSSSIQFLFYTPFRSRDAASRTSCVETCHALFSLKVSSSDLMRDADLPLTPANLSIRLRFEKLSPLPDPGVPNSIPKKLPLTRYMIPVSRPQTRIVRSRLAGAGTLQSPSSWRPHLSLLSLLLFLSSPFSAIFFASFHVSVCYFQV